MEYLSRCFVLVLVLGSVVTVVVFVNVVGIVEDLVWVVVVVFVDLVVVVVIVGIVFVVVIGIVGAVVWMVIVVLF